MGLLRRRVLACSLALAAVPGTAFAGSLHADSVPLAHATLTAPQAVQRTCSDRQLAPGTPGVIARRLTIPTGGMLDARLHGSPRAADWDLAVFNTLTGRLLNGSAAFGGQEVVQIPVTAGDLVTIQACRVGGGATPTRLTVRDIVLWGTAPKPV